MGNRFKDFCLYYREFGAEFLAEIWGTWRTEVWPAVLIAALVFLLSYRHDPDAKTAFLYTAEACGIYLIGWAVYHLIRTPWKLSLRQPPKSKPVSFKQETIKLSEAVLDFIYSQSQRVPVQPIYSFGRMETAEIYRQINEQSAFNAALAKYEAETLGIYRYRFSKKILAAVKVLKDMGLRDEQMEDFWSNPKHSENIKAVGERLGLLVDQIPEENVTV